MKDDLIGRVVGHTVPHRLDPSQVEPGEPLDVTRTAWARVTSEHRNDPDLLIVQDQHTGVHGLVRRSDIHTTMTESYR